MYVKKNSLLTSIYMAICLKNWGGKKGKNSWAPCRDTEFWHYFWLFMLKLKQYFFSETIYKSFNVQYWSSNMKRMLQRDSTSWVIVVLTKPATGFNTLHNNLLV